MYVIIKKEKPNQVYYYPPQNLNENILQVLLAIFFQSLPITFVF